MATTSNFGWTTPDDSSAVKDGASAIRSLGTAVDTTMQTMVPKTIVDAKGDIIAATAADTVSRLAVGTDGQVLTAASGQATGLQWATVSGGGWTLLASGNVGANGVNITGIAGNSYQELVLRVRDCIANGDQRGGSIQINGLSGDYDYKYVRSGISTANNIDSATNSHYLGNIANEGSNYGNVVYYKFLNPASGTGARKQVNGFTYDVAYGYRIQTWGDVNTSAQITSINFLSFGLTSGTYALYGVK